MAALGQQTVTLLSSQGSYLKHGYLQKRQGGRYKKESERKRLKFHRQFCTLTRKSFSYREAETHEKKPKTFSVKRIKFVEDVTTGTFLENNIGQVEPLNFALCFQFGDEEEVIYVIPPTMEEKQEWMAALSNASENNGNKMLKYYHPGAYGSLHTEQWSCCMSSVKRQKGCKSVSDKAVLLDNASSLTSSIVIGNQQTSNAPSLARDRFLSASTSSVTSTETTGGESFTSSSSCYSIPEVKSASVHELHTAGIQQTKAVLQTSGPELDNWRKSTVTIISTDSGVCMQSRPVSTYTNLSGNISGFSTPRESLILQSQSDEGIVVNAGDVDNVLVVQQQSSKVDLKLVQSFKFSSSLLLIPSSMKLIAGTSDGMVWVMSQDCTEIQSAYLKVAGQIASLDSLGEYIAIGSAVVQLVKTSDSKPKRIIYRREKDRLMVPGRKHFVAFLGETGMLATAQLHGDSIDIWPPPSDAYLMMKPKSSIPVSGKILSLSASSKSNSPLISVLLEVEMETKLMVINWEDRCNVGYYAFLKGSANGSDLAFFSDGRNIAIAEDNRLQVYDVSIIGPQLSLKADKSFDAAISCLSSLIDNHMGVGLITGKFITCCYASTKGSLTWTHYNCSTNDLSNSPVVSISFVSKQRDLGLCVARKDGVLQLWKAASGIDSDHQAILREKSILGMELHKKGILSVPKNIEQTKSEQRIGHGVYITLPQEVVDENIQVESAFRPCGLGHYTFVLRDKMLPISQAIWLYATPQKKFKHPAKIKLAHCFQNENEKHQKLIKFLKADHEDIDRDEKGEISIKFKEVEKSQTEFPSSSYGILLDQHFCVYCLAVYCEEEEILGKVNYCLTILKPNAYPKDKAARIYCILHFDLEDCKRLVQEQIPEDYGLIVEKQFQFETGLGRYESALEIQIDDKQAIKRGWKISMESERKIYAEDVNFFNYRNTECLDAACHSPLNKHYPYIYPPRFVIEVSSQTGAESYVSETIINVTFTGAKHELSTDIQLNILRDEQDLNQPRVGGGEDYQGPATKEPYHFNGMWPK